MNQISKNTVKGTKQLKDTEYVKIVYAEEACNTHQRKIMFVGNSITMHGIAQSIGWNGCYGMAASSEDNDYVHVLMNKVRNHNPNTSYCICQVCEWESDYRNGESVYHLYQTAQDFDADIIVMRAIENCSTQDFDASVFEKEYDKLINFLNPSGLAKVILTTGFWKHPGDDIIREYSKENNLPLVELGDLGEDDKMKAIGKFEHEGVANHPGDLGMKTIAERIFDKVKDVL